MIWIALIVLIFLSGAISGSETALFGLPAPTLWKWRSAGSTLQRVAFHLMRFPRRVLMTVLMANTAVNVAIFVVSYIALRRVRDDHPALAVTIGVGTLLAVILFGEIVPKAVALAHAKRIAPIAAAAVSFVQSALGPVQWLLAALFVNPLVHLFSPVKTIGGPVTTRELKRLVQLAARDGAIDVRENSMLQAIIALGSVNVRELMAPRVDLQAISVDAPLAELKPIARRASGRALLVIGRDLDDIRGAVTHRDIYLNSSTDLRSLLRPVHFVPEQIDVVQLLRYFRNAAVHGAVVVDEYGGTAGFVAIRDVLMKIVGDLPTAENGARATDTRRIDDDTYELSGQLSARAWAERFDVGEIDRRVDTVAGLILWKLGRLPEVGDSVQLSNLTLTVLSMQHRRINRVQLKRDRSNPLAADSHV